MVEEKAKRVNSRRGPSSCFAPGTSAELCHSRRLIQEPPLEVVRVQRGFPFMRFRTAGPEGIAQSGGWALTTQPESMTRLPESTPR